jgi:hypothetical protein
VRNDVLAAQSQPAIALAIIAMPKRKKPISSVRERGSTFFENAAIHGEMWLVDSTRLALRLFQQ